MMQFHRRMPISRVMAIDPQRTLRIFPDLGHLSQALAATLLRVAQNAVENRGAFFLALSGGSLLQRLHQGLPMLLHAAGIDWPSWFIFYVDERSVPWDSPQSNHGAALRMFLNHLPIPKHHIYPVPVPSEAQHAALAYERCLKDLLPTTSNGIPRFDMVLLGLGEDGHIASLFPHHPVLDETVRCVMSVPNAPKPPPERITVTLPILNASRHIVLVVTGAHKADIVGAVLTSSDLGSAAPVRMIHPVDGELLWMMDREAAHHLETPL